MTNLHHKITVIAMFYSVKDWN